MIAALIALMGSPFWTGIGPVKLADIRRPVVECRREHMMRFPASWTRA
jgi:hypothetical protein